MTPSGGLENGSRFTSRTDYTTVQEAVERTEEELRDTCHRVQNHEPNSDLKNLRSLRQAKAVNNVMLDYFSQTTVEAFSIPELKVKWEYAHEVVTLGDMMKKFRRNVLATGETAETGTDEQIYVDKMIRTSVAEVVRQMYRVLNVLKEVADDATPDARTRARKIFNDITDGLAIYSTAYDSQANAASVEIDEASDSVALGKYFENRATRERRTADGLRAAAILLLMSITGLAGFILFGSSLDSDVLGAELAKLSTTVPLAVLAGYLSRESSRHRSTSDRCGELGAHLLHLDSYISKLSREEQRRYRYELGQRAFVAEYREVGDAGSPGLLGEITQFVETLKNVASREGK